MAKRLIAVLVDLSGTLHIEDAAVPRAIEALQRLRLTNLKIKFVTNTTKESKETLLNRLRKIGFDIKAEEIFSSLSAARSLLVKQNLRPYFLLSEDALKDFSGISTSNPNAVVIGLAPHEFNYENITKAFRLLMDGSTFIAIHKGRYYKKKDGLAPGPGVYVAGLEYATGCTSIVVGKPEADFYYSALHELGCTPESAFMIGDDVHDDIGGAMQAGLKGILVKTGKYRSGDENLIQPPPTHTCESFADAVDYILADHQN